MSRWRRATRGDRWTVAAAALVAVVAVAALATALVGGGDEGPGAPVSQDAAPAATTTREAPTAAPAPDAAAPGDDRPDAAGTVALRRELAQRARGHVGGYASDFNRRFTVSEPTCVELSGRRLRCRVPLVHHWGVYNLNLHYEVRATGDGSWEVLRRWQTG